MHITELKLTNFKNYEYVDVSFSSGYNLITGNNGEGKTNLLDAIYLLCMTKSFFQYSDKNMVSLGRDFFRVEGHFNPSEEMVKVVCKFKIDGGKAFEVDDKLIRKYSSFIGKIPVVMISPNDIQLIEKGSEERRKFIDISICQVFPQYLVTLNNYNKVVKLRNTLLKQLNRGESKQHDLAEYYAEQMATYAVEIIASRREFSTQLSQKYLEVYNSITEGKEAVSCSYHPNIDGTKSEILTQILQVYQKDLVLEYTTKGIHRDDIEFYIKDTPVKRIGSQGQIKSAIFAAKLAQYQWLSEQKNSLPILLLDDIFDKLDHNRVGNVLQMIDSDQYGQIFITDTYESRNTEILSYLHKSVRHIHIDQGQLHVRV